jgi:hypothetical protein
MVVLLYAVIGARIVVKHCLYNANVLTKRFSQNILHVALLYQPNDLCLAFYITMDYVTIRSPIHKNHRNPIIVKHILDKEPLTQLVDDRSVLHLRLLLQQAFR